MTYRHLLAFDSERDFVTLTFFRAAGIPWERGVPFDKEAVDSRVLKLLYENHKIGYAEPSDEEGAASIAPVTLEEAGGGWYTVNVSWLEEPENIQGHDKALLRAQQIRDAGEPQQHHGVAVIPGENGWFTLNALWLAEPEKVHGEETARARAAELRDAGPPAGWDPDALIGSDGFEASYQIGEATVALGDIVSAAQLASGHDKVVWNRLGDDVRKPLIQAELDRQLADVKPAEGGAAGDAGGAAEGGGTPAADPVKTKEERIAALVDGNNTSELTAIAEGLDGLAAAKGKTAIATLIVEAGRDQKADDGGAA